VEAKDGDEAMRIMIDHPIDVVLLNYTLPGESGLATAARIRELEERVFSFFLNFIPNYFIISFTLFFFFLILLFLKGCFGKQSGGIADEERE
jgi:PleD family two-component response regulator